MEGRWLLHSCPAGPGPGSRGAGAGGAGEGWGAWGSRQGIGDPDTYNQPLEVAGAGLAYTTASAWRGDKDRHQSQEVRDVHLAQQWPGTSINT